MRGEVTLSDAALHAEASAAAGVGGFGGGGGGLHVGAAGKGGVVAGGPVVLGGGGRERVGREEDRDEGATRLSVEDLEPLCHAALLRNQGARWLHLVTCV